MGDRESDIYDVFAQSEPAPYELLIRSAQDRRVEHATATHLWEAVESSPILGTVVIDVPRKEGHPIRQATLTVQATTVRLKIPQGRVKEGLGTPTVQVIMAKETEPPADTAPILWVLCTTMPVADFADARRYVEWYTYRWRERFHFVLKTGGSNVEKPQLETYERLARAIALDSIVAWRILWMTYQVRQDPDQPCSGIFTSDEEAALGRAQN